MRQLTILLMATALMALAETRGAVEVKGSIGYTGFADDSLLNHLQTGGSAKFYVTKRFSVEPEFQYLRGSRGHYDLVLLPNVNWDLRDGGRVVPFLTGGVGWTQGLDRFSGIAYRYNQTFFQIGGGWKVHLNDRWHISPEIRVGSELHIRASIAFGYTFRR